MRERNLLFPGIIGAVVILGLALIAVARSDYQDAASSLEPRIGTHWHASFGIYVCGEWVPAQEAFDTPMGIHSHGDGALHIHPTSRAASGENARLGVYADESPLIDFSDTELTVGDQTWVEGEDTCEVDGEEVDAEVVVAKWDNAFVDDSPDIYYTGLRSIRFLADGEGYVVAFVPEGETDDIPKPPSNEVLSSLSPTLTQEICEELDPDDRPEGVEDCSELPTEAEVLGLAEADEGDGSDDGDDAESGDGEGDEETDDEGPVLPEDDSAAGDE